MIMMTNAILMLSGACIGASIAGMWWMSEMRRYWRVSDETVREIRESYEAEIKAYRSHINRLYCKIGIEPLHEHGSLN